MKGSDASRSSSANHAATSVTTGSTSTPRPARRSLTRSPSNLNSRGSRTAWLRPFLNSLAVVLTIPRLVYTRSIDHLSIRGSMRIGARQKGVEDGGRWRPVGFGKPAVGGVRESRCRVVTIDIARQVEPQWNPGTRKVVGATGFEPATPCAQEPRPAIIRSFLQHRTSKWLIHRRILRCDPCLGRAVPICGAGAPGAWNRQSEHGFGAHGEAHLVEIFDVGCRDAGFAGGCPARGVSSSGMACGRFHSRSLDELQRLGPCCLVPTPSEHPQDRIEHRV